ncbi:MAG TPA: hypothetical protein VFE46_08195 [Pirellulales bacterium]|nr:hypothetical protein [Pirellulales bacterium]
MNPFRQVIQDMSLTHDAQGSGSEFSWLYLLLSIMADNQDADPVEPTYPSAKQEVLYRLQNYRGTFAGQRISQLLNFA